MPRIITFASGNIWRWDKTQDFDKLIPYAKSLKLDGFELTFKTKEQLYAFKISKANEKWLKSLKYVTIHAPFKLVRKADGKLEIIRQLQVIETLYKKFNAKNVIIHPLDLPNSKILNRFNFKVSTENLTPKSKFTISKLNKTLKKYPKIGLCLDVSHAYLWSKYETEKLVKTFDKRITQIHLSGTYRKSGYHSMRIVTDNFMFSIKPIFKLNVPIVIEEDMKIKSKKLLTDEVNYIKEMFRK
ncbi:MAG: hypothetical protein WCW66_00700 [Patescibacteria group bacterium]